jgi:CDP-glucose 4,6-dehydratase
MVNVTSDKCYENREWLWGYREDEMMGGHDPYSSSKGCAELVTSAYRSSFMSAAGIALGSARAGNVIGGGDWALDRIVPDILRAIEKSRPVVIRNPHAVRPWQHVLEPLSGYLMLAQKLGGDAGSSFAEGWNFGPRDEDARPVRWIVEKIISKWGGDQSYVVDGGDHPHEAGYLKLDSSKARRRFDWAPHWSLDTALTKIVDWHRAWLDGSDVQETCRRQISDFTAISNSKDIH